MDSDHESADCPDARIPGHHICRNCKDKKGFKTHNAGEKTKFHYFSRCKTLKIPPEDKYIEFREKIKVRDTSLNNKNSTSGLANKIKKLIVKCYNK